MAKRKIGELYDKPIIIGSKNQKTKNEIHISDVAKVIEELIGPSSNDTKEKQFKVTLVDTAFENPMPDETRIYTVPSGIVTWEEYVANDIKGDFIIMLDTQYYKNCVYYIRPGIGNTRLLSERDGSVVYPNEEIIFDNEYSAYWLSE